MNQIHIDKATNTQLNYATAVGQGWVLKTFADLDDTEKKLRNERNGYLDKR